MPTWLKTYTVQKFLSDHQNGVLDTSPDIQRRAVWPLKSKMLLVDSIARGVPINAITLYEDAQEGGYNLYEVIDGKQRLRSLFEFLDGEYELNETLITNADEEEIAEVGKERAAPLYGKSFKDLDFGEKQLLLQYEIPVFIVSGSRDQAVQAFTRMNQNSYVLKPQEIRNAVYRKSAFLKAGDRVCSEFAPPVPDEPSHESGLVRWGVLPESAYDRMQDIQFASELLALALEGEQHRRDSLNDFYDKYKSDSGAAAKKLKEAESEVLGALTQWAEIFDAGVPLGAFHFPKPCENDVYALVGAALNRGLLTKPQMALYAADVRDGVSVFRALVTNYVASVRGEADEEDLDEGIRKYGQTLLGGQVNGLTKRATRREVLVELLNGLVPPANAKGFTPLVRQLIWARSKDKRCERPDATCGGAVVEWADFHAGHIKPKALGGPSTLSNGRVEHKACNLAAGAS
jgi:hypothetical protein